MLQADIEKAKEIVELIRFLTQDEGDEVRIYHDNPDFGGPKCSIAVVHRFGLPFQLWGDSVLECLQEAKKR